MSSVLNCHRGIRSMKCLLFPLISSLDSPSLSPSDFWLYHNNISWGSCGFVSFGAQNAVAIVSPETAQILTTLPVHKATVNCTHWLPISEFAFRGKHMERQFLLFGDADGVIMLWEFSLSDQKWKPVLQVPETHKKGITCIAAILVSDEVAMFAQSATVAEIWLWQVGSWKSVGRLNSHTLTVTQMEFSHDNKMLLAVSRDRQFSVFHIDRTGIDDISHRLLARQEAHKRIIWTCSWKPFSHEFATGSQDKTVKIWGVEGESSVKLTSTLPTFSSSVTALSSVGLDQKQNSGLLVVGMENGLIELWALQIARTEATEVPKVCASLAARFDPLMCHVPTVNRLSWRNREKVDGSGNLQLSACGADQCARLFNIDVE